MTERPLSSAESGYLFDNRGSEAGPRFDSLAELFNPVTFRHIDALGIAAGWRCWEVGVGGPSVPVWLASKVGSSGHVLATDIDVSWTHHLAGENVEVRLRRTRSCRWPSPRGPSSRGPMCTRSETGSSRTVT